MKIRKSLAVLLACCLFAVGYFPRLFLLIVNAESINLAEGKQVTVETGEPVSFSHLLIQPELYNTGEKRLTDGVIGMTDNSSSAWYRAFGGGSRTVTLDLGEVKPVDGFEAFFLHAVSLSVVTPRYLRVYLSGDGEGYQRVEEVAPDFPLSQTTVERVALRKSFSKPFKARYVKLEFPVDTLVYCDEIRVYGSATLTGSEQIIKPQTAVPDPGMTISLGGVHSIAAIGMGMNKAGEQVLLDDSKLLPYLAYLRPDGTFTDSMFESILIKPASPLLASGRSLYKVMDGSGGVLVDWEDYVNSMFTEGYNLDALENAADRVFGALDRRGKLPVYITIPYPSILQGEFGTLNGNDNHATTLEERLDAVKWFVERCRKEFNNHGYKRISLAGFVWSRSEIDFAAQDAEAGLLADVSRSIIKTGLRFLFTPSYLSAGYTEWKQYGFTAALMDTDWIGGRNSAIFRHEMLDEYAETLKKHGLGAAFTLPQEKSFSEETYLSTGLAYEYFFYHGWKNGSMNGMTLFTEPGENLTLAMLCGAADGSTRGENLRTLYDKTYQYLRKQFSALPPMVNIPNFEAAEGQKNVRIPMEIIDPDSALWECSVLLTKPPAHGTVTPMANMKSIVFSADVGYTGTDSFELVVFDKFSYSEPITVQVTIVNARIDESSNEVDSGEESDTHLNERNSRLWIVLTVVAGVGVVAAAGSVGYLIMRNKKTP